MYPGLSDADCQVATFHYRQLVNEGQRQQISTGAGPGVRRHAVGVRISAAPGWRVHGFRRPAHPGSADGYEREPRQDPDRRDGCNRLTLVDCTWLEAVRQGSPPGTKRIAEHALGLRLRRLPAKDRKRAVSALDDELIRLLGEDRARQDKRRRDQSARVGGAARPRSRPIAIRPDECHAPGWPNTHETLPPTRLVSTVGHGSPSDPRCGILVHPDATAHRCIRPR